MDREQHGGGTESGCFLRARRGQVTLEEVGLPADAGPRRTSGLRREEVATLARIGIDHYARLERGEETGPSPSVVDALARALRLEDAEHEHLRSLVAPAARTAAELLTAPNRTVRPGIRLLMENMRPNPARVVSRTGDVLAHNPGGLRLLAGLEDWPVKQRNIGRYVFLHFLHPAARDLFDDWSNQVRGCVAQLRALAGADPDAPDLAALAGELLLNSPEFARLRERYDVKGPASGRKTFHHPDVDHDTMVLLDLTASDTGRTANDPLTDVRT